MNQLQVMRPLDNRILAGVCAGLALRFGLTPWGVRALFLLSLLIPGPQAIAYVVLWALMPSE